MPSRLSAQLSEAVSGGKVSPHQAYPLLKHVKRQKKKIPCPYNNGPCSIVSLPSFVLPPPAFPPPTVWAFPGINNGQLARSRHNHQRVRCALLYFLLCAFVFFAFANFFFFFLKILAGAFVKLIHVADGIYMYVMLVVASCAINLDNFF